MGNGFADQLIYLTTKLKRRSQSNEVGLCYLRAQQ
jgi:hypothetical protein